MLVLQMLSRADCTPCSAAPKQPSGEPKRPTGAGTQWWNMSRGRLGKFSCENLRTCNLLRHQMTRHAIHHLGWIGCILLSLKLWHGFRTGKLSSSTASAEGSDRIHACDTCIGQTACCHVCAANDLALMMMPRHAQRGGCDE